jgi:hypothetical protein
MSFHGEINPESPFDNAAITLMQQGNRQIPEVGYLVLNHVHLSACIEVFGEQTNNFQYIADHIRHSRHKLESNPIVKEAWNCVISQFVLICARTAFMRAVGFRELDGNQLKANCYMSLRGNPRHNKAGWRETREATTTTVISNYSAKYLAHFYVCIRH